MSTKESILVEELPKDCVFGNDYNIWEDKDLFESEVLTRKKVIDIVKRFSEINLEDVKIHPDHYGTNPIKGEGDRYHRIERFLRSLQVYKKLRREGRYHNALCEYALGFNCDCWCKEKYHGLKGAKHPDEI